MTLTLQDVMTQLENYAADEVAQLLRLAGKTGDVGDQVTCPVAHYLEDVLGKTCYVDTDTAWVASSDFHVVDLPGGVRAFVSAFDAHFYPDLITEED